MVDVADTTTVSWALGQTGKTVVLTVTAPDSTTSTPTVTETTGVYSAAVPTPQSGQYKLRWVTTGAANTDVINVWPQDPRFIISFDEAVSALRWRDNEARERAEDLRLHIASATEVLEDIVGAVLVRTVVHNADGGTGAVVLAQRPDTINSVTVNGVACTSYVADKTAGIIYAGSSLTSTFPEGRQIVRVTYTTGAAAVSPSIIDAARILVRHMVSREEAPRPTPGVEGEFSRTPSGFLVPNAVIELCANRRPLPGIA
jgi:hypothetical protein